ncbi:efflux RND transporter periplasmic adaptor subunit [Nitratireductor sp. XY-223]|uniref:efflux RND transporter periplasmic adaptor subunit n=1 Tax=Nitratireductor sp. XY-223 TaxID=2561926 RepID=UPI0010AB1953|nr:efflux RND transporter periplasmic adaptor subunit [Nitratireductor sp. XY-223]
MLKSINEEEAADSAAVGDTPDRPQDRRSPLLSGGRVVLQVVLMMAVLGGSYVIMNRIIESQPERSARTFRPTVYPVETVAVTPASNRPQLLLYGEVQAARSVELRPLVNGEIIAVNPDLKAGSHVAAGDELMEIDSFHFKGALSEARANLAQARATLAETEARIVAEKDQLEGAEMQLALAESDLKRAESLVESGTLTEKQVEDRRLIVSQREQAVSQRRNNQIIEDAKREQQIASIESLTWKVQQAERNLENTVLRAPFTGVVNSENAEPGRYVSSSDVVASLYDDEALEVRFTLTDAQYGRISTDADPLIGRAIGVVWVVGLSSYEYSGRIDRIAAEIASQRGGVEVVARLDPNSSPVQLRPGAFVEIDVPDRTYDSSFRIPETALFNGNEVFVVEDGKLARRIVEIAAFDGEDVIVLGGLQSGDVVMTTHLTQADDGVQVREPGARPAGPRGDGVAGQRTQGS